MMGDENFESVTQSAFSMAETQMGQDLYQRQVKNAEANADLMSAHAERIRTFNGAVNVVLLAMLPFYVAGIIFIWKLVLRV